MDGHWKLGGLCRRHGWAFVFRNQDERTVAAAHGRPPLWARGTFGAELWGLLQAAMCSVHAAAFFVDCQAVQRCIAHDPRWARAPERALGRAWAPPEWRPR